MSALTKHAGKAAFVFLLWALCPVRLRAQTPDGDAPRSLGGLFPFLTETQKELVLSDNGFIHAFLRRESPLLIPGWNAGAGFLGKVLEKQPTHVIEALIVVPYAGRTLGTLDAYNAVRRIRNIQDYRAFSSRRNAEVPVFEDAAMLESDRRRNPVPDPLPVQIMPSSDTMFLRLKDAAFGNLFLRGDFSASGRGIIYNMTNFIPVRFLIFTVMRAEKFSAVIYVEPLEEGMMIYAVSAFDVPEFLASNRNISVSAESRINVFVKWIRDGLKAQD